MPPRVLAKDVQLDAELDVAFLDEGRHELIEHENARAQTERGRARHALLADETPALRSFERDAEATEPEGTEPVCGFDLDAETFGIFVMRRHDRATEHRRALAFGGSVIRDAY